MLVGAIGSVMKNQPKQLTSHQGELLQYVIEEQYEPELSYLFDAYWRDRREREQDRNEVISFDGEMEFLGLLLEGAIEKEKRKGDLCRKVRDGIQARAADIEEGWVPYAL